MEVIEAVNLSAQKFWIWVQVNAHL